MSGDASVIRRLTVDDHRLIRQGIERKVTALPDCD